MKRKKSMNKFLKTLPPTEFIEWWKRHPDNAQGIKAHKAYTCTRYRQEYLRDKEVGL